MLYKFRKSKIWSNKTEFSYFFTIRFYLFNLISFEIKMKKNNYSNIHFLKLFFFFFLSFLFEIKWWNNNNKKDFSNKSVFEVGINFFMLFFWKGILSFGKVKNNKNLKKLRQDPANIHNQNCILYLGIYLFWYFLSILIICD